MTDQIPQPQPPLTPEQERQWAMIAHLSVLVNLFTVFMGTFVPLAIYFLHKDRSRYVAYHSMQSFVMQAVCSFGGSLFAVVIGGLSQFLPGIGLICLPISCLFGILPLAALIYGAYGGMQVNQGKEFKYWMIGDWVANMMG
jgi:hypothetical protein